MLVPLHPCGRVGRASTSYDRTSVVDMEKFRLVIHSLIERTQA